MATAAASTTNRGASAQGARRGLTRADHEGPAELLGTGQHREVAGHGLNQAAGL